MEPFPITSSALAVLWRYFDGVSSTLSKRMTAGSSPSEPVLTYLLCELLDEGWTGQHLLDYSLQQAKADLEALDCGVTLDVTFETVPHSAHVEAKYSGADLGLVFTREHPLMGRSERGVLLQAKRLFPRPAGYDLLSSYESFDQDQFKFLKALQRRFSAYRSVFYLWYNPASRDFEGEAGRAIRSVESDGNPAWWGLRGRWHPLMDELIEFGWPMVSREHGGNGEQAAADLRWRSEQPATRVSGLEAVDALGGSRPSIGQLYRLRAGERHRPRDWPFEPFADLVIRGLVAGAVGDAGTDWIRLARGEKVPWPTKKDGARPPGDEEGPMPNLPPAPRHTIRLFLRSTIHWPDDLRARG